MKYAKLVKNIKTKNWYRQGGELSFFYTFRPYKSIYILLGYNNCVNTQKGRVNIAYFNKDEETKKAEEIIKKATPGREYINKRIKKWHHLNDQMTKLLQSRYRRPLSRWNDQELVDNLEEITKLFLDCWVVSLIIEVFDPEGDKILAELIKQDGASLSSEEIAILTSPDNLTEQQQEFVERIRIAQESAAGKDISGQLAEHQQKYFWIKNNWYNVRELPEKYFRDLIEDDKHSLNKRIKESEKITKTLNNSRKEKKTIVADKKISPQLQNIFYLFSQMAEWRDVRKKSICIANHYFYQILKQFNRVNDIGIELLHFLNLWDIRGWKLPPGIEDELKKRQAGIVYLYGSKKTEWSCFYGEEAQALYNLLDKSIIQAELKGMCASRGTIEGIVKVVKTNKDFSKVQPGDIIVAPMTRPDYLPIMKIAGGIVTEEGGLTCHAAIVARELKIPCVVGVQAATSVLEDGDRIKLDAEGEVIEKL